MSSVHYENVKNKLYAQYSEEISQLLEKYNSANCNSSGEDDDQSKDNFTISYPAQRLMCLRAANKFTPYYDAKKKEQQEKSRSEQNSINADNENEEILTDSDIVALLANVNIRLGDDVSSKELSMQFVTNNMRRLQDESVRRLQSVAKTSHVNSETDDDTSCVHDDTSAQRMLILHKLEEQLAREKVVCKASRIDVK